MKKAMFFTLIAIVLLSLVTISITIISLSHERDSVKKRIGALNDYVFSIEEDLTRKLYISGYRFIFLFEKRIIENGTYISNVNDLFNEGFFNGTIDGVISFDEQQLISGVMFSDIENDLRDGAKKVNLNISLSNPILSLTQEDPWNLKASLRLDLYIYDINGFASWNRTATFYSYIPIENFEDPLYLINTNGLISHKVKKTSYDYFLNGTNVSNLLDHLNKSYYYATNESPSFINRLEGNFSNNIYGVESFVDIQELIDNGLSVSDKSVVDHIYFSESNPSTKTISGMPSWFKIDDSHVSLYNLSSVAS